MSIPVGQDIGLELHPETDQFLRVEEGQGLVQMGNSKDNLYFRMPIYDDSAIFVPKGTWHNLINTGNKPLKLYTIYAPPNHKWGTVHKTKAEAEAEEH
jgi:mannose-6-phosphate isomerase-like protein (cupin superfamily)